MIIGNCTRDPEMRYVPSGQGVTSFSVATNRRWTQDGEEKEETEFHSVVAWGKLAEIAHQVLKKGAKVYIEGRLKTRSWEGQDGVTRQRTEIIADNIIALSPKEKTESETFSESKTETPVEETKKSFDSASASTEATKNKDEKKPKAEKSQTKDEKHQKKEQTEKDEKTSDKDTENKNDEEIDIDDIPF